VEITISVKTASREIYEAFVSGGLRSASLACAPYTKMRDKIMSELMGSIQLIHLEKMFLTAFLDEAKRAQIRKPRK
jgi:hypothetical protein